MKRLVFLVILVGLGWSGYWIWASQAHKGALEQWFAERRADGWQAEYSELTVNGFPNRLDSFYSDLRLSDPDAGLGWHAPIFQIFMLSYQRGHIIAAWPQVQTVTVDRDSYAVQSDGLRASLVYDPGAGPIQRANLEAETLNIEGPAGTLALAGLRLAAQAEPSAPNSYRFALAAQGIAKSRRGLAHTLLSDDYAELRADILMQFDTPWHIPVAAKARPKPTQMTVKLAEFQLGDLDLKAAGTLDIDPEGRLDGDLTLKAVNWRDILHHLRDSGEMPLALADSLEQGLSLIAALNGNQKTLDLPMRFRRGRVSLGPVPLGQAPRLKLR